MLQQSVVVVEVYLFVETEARVSTVTVILWIKPKCNNRLLIWLAVFEQKLKQTNWKCNDQLVVVPEKSSHFSSHLLAPFQCVYYLVCGS